MIATRGILRPGPASSIFTRPCGPPTDLAGPLGRSLDGQLGPARRPEFEQEILPFPCVNLACEAGQFFGCTVPARPLRGPPTRARWVPASAFDASFLPFATAHAQPLDRVSLAADVMSRAPAPAPQDPRLAREALLEFVRSFGPLQAPPILEQVNALVERAQIDRSIAKAEDLALIAAMSVRSLHRTLERYVGVSSKWIVRRARIQQCADRVANGEQLDWARLSQDLGYHDQAHLIRDFKAQIGYTPSAYAAQCRG